MSWQNRTVLVTGAAGFIGSHLVERLASLGARVRAFCHYNSNGSWGWLDGVPVSVKGSLDVRLGDIRDGRFVADACSGVDTVFHLAALIAIPYSYQAPESFVDTNVKGTLNVLEAVRQAGCRRVVHVSTSEVYGTPDQVPIREGHALKGQSPYSASKIAADKLCEAYHCAFRVPVVVVRPFNTFGPRQSARAVLPAILTQLLSGAATLRLGRLDPKRDLTFVDDTVEGFVLAGAAAGVDGEVIQLGTGRTVSIGELAQTACRVVGKSCPIVQEEQRLRPDASEVLVLQSDPTLARERLGWQPTVSLEEGVRRTAIWLGQNLHRYDPSRYQV